MKLENNDPSVLLTTSPSPPGSVIAQDMELAPLPEYKVAGTTSVDFGGLLGSGDDDGKEAPALLLREDVSSGCGGQLWPAGMVLARHMLRYHRNGLGGARILELGAGGGLVSLAVARACSKDSSKPLLILTDQQEMLSLMEHNIRLNGVEDMAKAMVLNWGEDLPQEVITFRPDVILAADCVYFEPAFPLLLATMSELLELCPGATIYFCFQKRRRADMQFLKKARKSFCVAEVFDADRPVFSRLSQFLYTISSK